jgi:hypothetical protein
MGNQEQGGDPTMKLKKLFRTTYFRAASSRRAWTSSVWCHGGSSESKSGVFDGSEKIAGISLLSRGDEGCGFRLIRPMFLREGSRSKERERP